MANYKDVRYNFALPSNAEVGSMTLIKEQTASSSATISFVHGTSDVVLDSTYPIYKFKFINIHPQTDNKIFQVNFRDGDSSYDATKTTTVFRTQHTEDGSANNFGYMADYDLAQSTAVQQLLDGTGNDNDQSLSGEMYLFDPSSTTFVKHFMVTLQGYRHNEYSAIWFTAGYCNVTAAIDGVQFSMNSGNIDSGTIKLYGIKN